VKGLTVTGPQPAVVPSN